MKKLAKIAALVLCSLLVALLLLELGIRQGWVGLPNFYDSGGWWKERWERQSGGNLMPVDGHHAQLGHVLRKNLDGLGDCPRGTIRSNSKGIRGTKEHPLRKKPGTVRVLAIGDSFTFGSCVKDEETFSAYLEKKGCEVINMGVQGYGTDQIYLRYLLEGRKYGADYVVYGFYEDDIRRNRLSFRTYIKPVYVPRGDGLKLTGTPIEHPRAYRDGTRLRLLNYLEIYHDWIRDESLSRRNDLVTDRLHDALIDAIKKQGARPVLVFLPKLEEVMDNSGTPDIFKNMCARHSGVTCVNPIPRLHKTISRSSRAASHFQHHYSPLVHRLIAEALAEQIPCSRPTPTPRRSP